MPGEDERGHELSKVLCEEFESLRPGCFASVDSWDARDEKKKCQEAYRVARHLGLSALALSGGGIRSACVGLGVIQSLAEAKLLHQFDYLSTVSGGGYIGSWLSVWLHWNKAAGKIAKDDIKPVVRGDEPAADIIAYARATKIFLTNLPPNNGSRSRSSKPTVCSAIG